MGAQLLTRAGKVSADLFAFDGDDRLPIAQHSQVHFVGLIGVDGELRIDLVGVGIVVAEQPQDRQHEIELGALLVAAGAHQADGPLGNCAKPSAQFVLSVHRSIPPPWAPKAPNQTAARNLEHGRDDNRSAGARSAVDRDALSLQALTRSGARYRVTRTHREHIHGSALRASRLHPSLALRAQAQALQARALAAVW